MLKRKSHRPASRQGIGYFLRIRRLGGGNRRCPVHTVGSDLGQAPVDWCGILVVITPPRLQHRASSSPPPPQSFPPPFWRFPCHPQIRGAPLRRNHGAGLWVENQESGLQAGRRLTMSPFFWLWILYPEQVLPNLKIAEKWNLNLR